MSEICKLVPSQKGQVKLEINGYLMVKDKNRNDLFYWHCEHKKTDIKCGATASTVLVGTEHHLRKHGEHNHAAEASKQIVLHTLGKIKESARQSHDHPSQIIQNTLSQMPQSCRPSMPSREALRKRIKRVRREELPPEPQSIDEFIVPEIFKNTLSGEENFLLRDSTVGNNRILIFSTAAEIRYLAQAMYWIMDGTFKTVPTLFQQLYTIHAPVGGENSRILPLVYVLMTSKSQECYTRLFEDLRDLAEERELELEPLYIITDFELGVINASRTVFPTIQNKGCFFHLGQSVWRKVQSLGLSKMYGENENFSLIVRHLPALAFLPSAEIAASFTRVKAEMPQEADNLITWFEENYVLGRIRRTFRNGSASRHPPLFPPDLWSIYENNNLGLPRTQNKVEAWHRRWETLIGRAHVGVHFLLQNLQKEQQHVANEVELIVRGEPRPSLKKQDEQRKKRIQTIVNDRGNRSVMDFLRGIAHNLSF